MTGSAGGSGLLVPLLLGLLALAALVIIALALRRPGGRREDDEAQLAAALNAALSELGQVRQVVYDLGRAQAEVRTQIGDLHLRVQQTSGDLAQKTIQAQGVIQREIAEAQKLVQEVRTELGERKKRDDEVERAVRHLEAVLAGTPGKGAAGENILEEAFASFPPEMVERNFRVRGKVVEYALVLGGGERRMPIDSKWPATSAIERLVSENDPAERQKAVAEVRADLRRKVREVAQYIDPLTTTDKAIAAVPDAVYPHCRELAFEAYRQGVIIMPYSMLVPYVLNLYNLHLRHTRSVDLEALDHSLADIERYVDSLEKILEDRIHRGATMVGNAYADVRHIAAQIRLALSYVRALPAVAERQALGEGGKPEAVREAEDEAAIS